MASMHAGMGPAPTTTWEQVRSVLGQLETLCTTAGDAQNLDTLRRTRLDLQDIFATSETTAKRALMDLQKTLAAEQASAAEMSEPLDRIRSQVDALEAQKGAIVAHLAAMQQTRDTSAAAIQRLLAATIQYKDMIAALNSDHDAQVPRTKHFLTLFAIITAIRWDYDSSKIQGYIAPPKGAPVRPFCIDEGLSPCAVADALWEAVGSAHGLA